MRKTPEYHHHHHHHHHHHGVGPLVDPFRSHVSRSLFKSLLSFLLLVREWYFITLGNLFLYLILFMYVLLIIYLWYIVSPRLD